MSREIKYKRVWFTDESKETFSHSDTWGVNIDGAAFKSPSSNNFASVFTDCQFTGLKDRNGKEIYESDEIEACVFFVSPENPDDDIHFRGIVVFKDAMFQIKICAQMSHHTNGQWTTLDWRCGLGRDLIDVDGSITIPIFELMAMSGNLGEYDPENIEIIGNIYEHKHLLETPSRT